MDGARRKPGVGGLALPSTAAASQAGGSRVGVKLPEASVAEGRCRLASGPVSSAQASQGGARARGFRQGWREERRGGGGTVPARAGAPGAPTGWGRSSGVLRPRARDHGDPRPPAFQATSAVLEPAPFLRGQSLFAQGTQGAIAGGLALPKDSHRRTWGHCPQAHQVTGVFCCLSILFLCVHSFPPEQMIKKISRLPPAERSAPPAGAAAGTTWSLSGG